MRTNLGQAEGKKRNYEGPRWKKVQLYQTVTHFESWGDL